MANASPQELAIVERCIRDFIFDSQISHDIVEIQDALTHETRPLNIAELFTNHELAKYEANLRLLLAGYESKLQERYDSGRSWTNVYYGVEESVLTSAALLRARVGHLALPLPNDTYIRDLREFWRVYGGHGRAGHSMSWHYDDVWTFVSGRTLLLD